MLNIKTKIFFIKFIKPALNFKLKFTYKTNNFFFSINPWYWDWLNTSFLIDPYNYHFRKHYVHV